MENLTHEIIERMTARGATFATAESCTGGLIAASITDVPGASRAFAGGVVAYSNDLKTRLLGVAPATLGAHGAVSAEAAREMAAGAVQRLGVDYAVSVTGIAGPDGGTADKPVGLVYLGVAGPRGVTAVRRQFDGNRDAVRARTVQAALELLWEATQ